MSPLVGQPQPDLRRFCLFVHAFRPEGTHNARRNLFSLLESFRRPPSSPSPPHRALSVPSPTGPLRLVDEPTRRREARPTPRTSRPGHSQSGGGEATIASGTTRRRLRVFATDSVFASESLLVVEFTHRSFGKGEVLNPGEPWPGRPRTPRAAGRSCGGLGSRTDSDWGVGKRGIHTLGLLGTFLFCVLTVFVRLT